MIVSIHQPQYLPWLGYFDKIDRADVFVLLDNVQFKKNEWQNRNRIKTAQGPQWLTVPVQYKFPQRIHEVEINNQERWQHRQRQAIVSNYRKAPFWTMLDDFFEEIFSKPWPMISDLNIFVVKRLATILGISTPVYIASELSEFPEDPDERLVAITRLLGADTYLAGSGGHDYMNPVIYEEAGIQVMFQDYKHPVYSQLFGQYEPYLSVIDLIFNHGPDSLAILRG
ncbi:MAG: hypothetical protein CSYNP_01123 [Syntrophus sp. SKADARSKE-3]|nr:hypothetical protein [Syntrophus sp. SKADARSKE-3]